MTSMNQPIYDGQVHKLRRYYSLKEILNHLETTQSFVEMSSFSNTAELHATSSVNDILAKVLPGMKKVKPANETKTSKSKGSKAQLIDHNLKKMIALQQRDVHKIKKKEKTSKKNALKNRQTQLLKLEKNAKLQVLQQHLKTGTLTEHETEYINKLTKRTVRNAKSWDMNDEEKEESLELQEYILQNQSQNKNRERSNKRRKRVKAFKEQKNTDDELVTDHRYPGLTPGLAPVGMSDEEESSDEERGNNRNDDW